MSDKRVYAIGAATRFNERRNTSRVWAVPPDALPAALRALASSRDEDWYRWVVAYGAQIHLHGTLMRDGKTVAACPVRGCSA